MQDIFDSAFECDLMEERDKFSALVSELGLILTALGLNTCLEWLSTIKSMVDLLNTTELANTPGSAVTFQDIVGCVHAKKALFENIILPLRMSTRVRETFYTGIRSESTNILLFGPPGTGKTLLAQACACEARLKFVSVSPSMVLSKYQGESEKAIRSIFDEAKALPSLMFLDELDSIACSRSDGDGGGVQFRRLLSELLICMSAGVGMKENITVVAATNRIQDIDEG